jgi:taurine dioxygenase
MTTTDRSSTNLSITPITSAIGARIDGIDLASASDEQLEQVRAALLRHLVVFVRDQDLTDEQHLALAGRFGTVSVYPVARLRGAPQPTASYIEDTADSPPDADNWHTDVTWIEEPPSIAFLNARVIPPVGGDTMWASLYAAYDSLSEPMQHICDSLTARHWFGEPFAKAISRKGGDELVRRLTSAYPYPGVEHPLVRTHPETGRKALFLSGFMREIVGMHPEESRILIEYLQSLLANPTLQVRWAWRPYDLAIWDERSTNHRALSDHYPAHRVMRRCTIDGGRPVFRPD